MGEMEVLRGSRPVLHSPSYCTGEDMSRWEMVEGWRGRLRFPENHDQFFTLPLTAQVRM